MFPLLRADAPNPLELFQIWLNLPAESKLADPYFSMLWARDVPVVTARDDHGRAARITVIAGAVDGHAPPAPPPDSWAARADAEVAIWHLDLEPGASWTLPTVRHDGVARVVYLYEGAARVGVVDVEAPTGIVVRAGAPAPVVAGDDGAEALVLQGRPIGQPVAQYGPFVMNEEHEIEEAFADYRRTGFGGWPWARDDPVHAADRGRFARHADGTEDDAESAPTTG
jgi:redox-sensitive bicupin YhaK (pirin superfamily)